MSYNKPPKTYEERLVTLQNRGRIISGIICSRKKEITNNVTLLSAKLIQKSKKYGEGSALI